MSIQRELSRLSTWLAVAFLAFGLCGCAAFRPRDDQRIEIAKEAVQLAQELAQPASDPFAAMKANVEAVQTARAAIDAIQTEDRKNTFYGGLSTMTRTGVLDELTSASSFHLSALALARGQVSQASAAVKGQLERQQQINKILGAPTDSKLETVVSAVDRRIQWLQQLQVDVARALTTAQQFDPEIASSRRFNEAQKRSQNFAGNLDAVNDFLTKIRSDPQVAAAGELLLRSGREVAQAELKRLAEMNKFLRTVERSRDALEQRNLLYYNHLMIPALAQVANPEEFATALQTIGNALKPGPGSASSPGQGGSSDQQIVGLIDVLVQTDDQTGEAKIIDDPTAKAIAARQKLWCQNCLFADFVSASIQAQRDAASAPPPPTPAPPPGGDGEPCCEDSPDLPTQGVDAAKLASSLAILLFLEEPADRAAALDLATQRHLHSITLSQVNAQERLAQAEMVAQALQIYYQGGITPAELAQAILLSSQVLATAYIGTQL